MTVAIMPDEYHHFHVHRDWSFSALGGTYGVIESEGFAARDPSDIVFETSVLLGPAELTVPCRAGTATVSLVVVATCISLAFAHLWRRHGASHTRTA